MGNLAQGAIAWIEANLAIPEGGRRGDPFTLAAWQKRFLRGWLAPGVSMGMLSVARGAGKSTLASAVACCAVRGTLAQPRSSIILVAASFAQASRCFGLIRDMLDAEIEADRGAWRIRQNTNFAELEYLPAKIRLRCCGANPQTLHGESPSLAILDEPGQWHPNVSERLFNAIRTAAGKQEASRIIGISTRPALPSSWFRRLLDEGAPGCFAQCYMAGSDDLTWRNVKAANPGIDRNPNLREAVRQELAQAKRDEMSASAFRAYRLNRGQNEEGRQALASAGEWAAVEVESLAGLCEGECVWALDAGAESSFSAVACFWPATGAVDALAVCGGEPSLEQRERRDRVAAGLYRACAGHGDLRVIEGKHTPGMDDLIGFALERFPAPVGIAADRFRRGEVVDALAARGMDVPIETRSFGYKDGGEDCREFRRELTNGRIRPRRSLLASASMASAETRVSVTGERLLAKGSPPARTPTGQDDVAVAVMLAVSSGTRLARAGGLAPAKTRLHVYRPETDSVEVIEA